LESFFGLGHEEIQTLTKEWVEEHFKLKVTTSDISYGFSPHLVEEHFKLKVTTSMDFITERTEKHFNLR
jgi:hypothetical protein